MFNLLDTKSFECSSPSELDRKFFGEQSLLSTLSLERLSTSKTSNGTLADESNLASLCLSSHSISSPPVFSTNSLNTQEPDNCRLTIPLLEKSSTPYMRLQKHKKAACFGKSCTGLCACQMPWDVSLINSENYSPKLHIESTALESTQSPKPESNHSLAEVCP